MRVDNHRATNIHRHDFYELVVILAGRGRHITDREEYTLEAGDVFLLRGNMAHGYADTEHMTLVNLLFDPDRLALPMPLLRDLPGYHALFRIEPRLRIYDRLRNRLRLQTEELTEVAGMIGRLQHELTRKAPGYRFQACAHLMHLIGFVSRCYSHSGRNAERPFLRLGEVLSYIELHYRNPITIGQLTSIAHVSESSLMRQFRRVLSRSPIEHVIRVRVLKAAELLQRGDVRVTEAAFACGFTDSNYFSRQFRRIMGASPREYRARTKRD
jgi:AraC-like DNA-binding protein